MRTLLWTGVVAAMAASVFAAWIVVHGYVDHGYLDRFHLMVVLATAGIALFLLYRLLRRRRA